jgi:lipid-A-disaccharide synthase
VPQRYTIGLLAGELSGDSLGAGLIEGLKSLQPDIEFSFIGVGGPKMLELGLEPLEGIENLSVNGFREPVLRLPYFFSLFKRLVIEFRKRKIDAFIGIDFNVLNFLIERRLKKGQIPTAHYVSPSVYAWRPGRVNKIAKSTDLLLCLFPFEPRYYEKVRVEARFVGHPLADEIAPDDSSALKKEENRAKLGLQADSTVIALLPGSRKSEIAHMLITFLDAAKIIKESYPNALFVIPCMNEELRSQVLVQMAKEESLEVMTYIGDARTALIACDVALTKAGTVTLEAALMKKPMVVAYKIGKLTYQFLRLLVKTDHFALPNIIAGKRLVPEFIQNDASSKNLAHAVCIELRRFDDDPVYLKSYEMIYDLLRQNANYRAARAVYSLLKKRK